MTRVSLALDEQQFGASLPRGVTEYLVAQVRPDDDLDLAGGLDGNEAAGLSDLPVCVVLGDSLTARRDRTRDEYTAQVIRLDKSGTLHTCPIGVRADWHRGDPIATIATIAIIAIIATCPGRVDHEGVLVRTNAA